MGLLPSVVSSPGYRRSRFGLRVTSCGVTPFGRELDRLSPVSVTTFVRELARLSPVSVRVKNAQGSERRAQELGTRN